MPTSPSIVQAVKAAIVASAHLAAFQQVAAAAEACTRLGTLTGGRWRSAARDLDSLEEDLHVAFADAAEVVGVQAEETSLAEDALWSVGDAAGTLALLRLAALEEVDADSRAARVLQGEVLFGAAFVEEPELPDRGTTLLFGWPEPMVPAAWPWQANWVTSDGVDGESSELDLFEAGEPEGEETLLSELAEELSCTPHEARTALREAALALTRASLLAGAADEEPDVDDGDEEPANGEP